MGHEWVFEVLADLAAYADQNGLNRLARKAEETLAVAREEIAGGAVGFAAGGAADTGGGAAGGGTAGGGMGRAMP